MRLTLLAYGTHGDVQPYVALGLGLKRAGHAVRIAAPALFEPFIRAHGLDFAPIAGDPMQISRELVDRGGGRPGRIIVSIIGLMRRLGVPVMRDIQAACHDADAIVYSLHMAVPGHTVARERGVPDIFAHFFPICATTSDFPSVLFPEWGLGRAYNVITHKLMDQIIWQSHRALHAWLGRGQPDLPRALYWPFGDKPTTTVFGFSPCVIPAAPDWGGHVHVTGYWFLDGQSDWQPSDSLMRFLDDGPPPVYVGFGSMVTRRAAKLAGIIREALRMSGQRGVVLDWWGGGGTHERPPQLEGNDLLVIESAPHDWLFPRMAAVAHHGGAGTTAAGLRAGVPSIVLPITNEQPFWGRRVFRLGVGPKPIPIGRLTAEKLAEAIMQAITNHAMRDRAMALGEKIRAEDGVARAVAIIEARLKKGAASDD